MFVFCYDSIFTLHSESACSHAWINERKNDNNFTSITMKKIGISPFIVHIRCSLCVASRTPSEYRFPAHIPMTGASQFQWKHLDIARYRRRCNSHRILWHFAQPIFPSLTSAVDFNELKSISIRIDKRKTLRDSTIRFHCVTFWLRLQCCDAISYCWSNSSATRLWVAENSMRETTSLLSWIMNFIIPETSLGSEFDQELNWDLVRLCTA